MNLPAAQKMVDSRCQDLLAASRPVVEREGVRSTSSPVPRAV
ncbi:hypothetical protein [Streptomyces bullii]|uniref:Uncharacterized protein n=1 Tax=Streptomyces bullii TaxID=349910 RepID=A0ABW0UZQ4_9ACTN